MTMSNTSPEQPVSPHPYIEKADNLFSPNACLNFEAEASESKPLGLSGISCVVEAPAERRLVVWQRAVELVARAVQSCDASLKPWVCTSDYTPNSAAGRWSAKRRLTDLDSAYGASDSCFEQVRASDGFVQICAAHQVEHEVVLAAKSFAERRHTTLLLWLPLERRPQLDELVKLGWWSGLYDHNAYRQIAVTVVGWGGILLKLFGDFDDVEAGVNIVLDPAIWPCVADGCQPWLTSSLFHGA